MSSLGSPKAVEPARRRAPGAAIQRTVERLAFPRTPAPPWPARRRASCGALLLGPCDGGGPERVRPLLGLAVARKFPCKPLKRFIPRPEIQRPSPPTGNAAKIRRGRPLWGGRHRAARKFRRKALKRLIPRPEIPHPNSSAGGTRPRSPRRGRPCGEGAPSRRPGIPLQGLEKIRFRARKPQTPVRHRGDAAEAPARAAPVGRDAATPPGNSAAKP